MKYRTLATIVTIALVTGACYAQPSVDPTPDPYILEGTVVEEYGMAHLLVENGTLPGNQDEELSYGVYSGETTQDKLQEEVAWLLSNGDYVQMEVTKVNVVGP